MRIPVSVPPALARRACVPLAAALATLAAHLDADARTVRHPNARTHDGYSYVPASFSFRDDRIVLHTNLGFLHEGEQHRTRMTWGVGSETLIQERAYLVAETFGQNHGRPLY